MYCVLRGVGSGLNDNEWHHVVVVVDELLFRLAASVDNVHRKSAPLVRCTAASQTDHSAYTQPVLITLAGVVISRALCPVYATYCSVNLR